jgi:two-component system, NarL family, nitrate/nitrite response regulator NarL
VTGPLGRALIGDVGKEGVVEVLIADDNGLFRSALDAILAAEPGVRVVGRATDGEEAVRMVAELKPDVVLMDLSMPVLDGFLATEQIQEESPGTRVLVLTGSPERTDIQRAEDAGAAGYVTKDRIASELVAAILTVAGRH